MSLDVVNQSKSAYNQWAKQWREHAKYHARYDMKSFQDFRNTGIGKAALLIANGYSFEENIETIKKYRDNVDIFVVDKALKHCLDNGIIPDFCVVCDANVSYEAYLKPVENQLDKTIMVSNVCANPEWSKNGNWKDQYFFVNKDVLQSEKEFSELSGCPNIMPAGTNVSNTLIIFLAQADNYNHRNFFGYDKMLMLGFDYCWDDDKYYSFDKDGGGKTNYMRMVYLPNLNGDLVYTSTNLLFSAKWADKYIATFKIGVVQCSKRSILRGASLGDLAEQMKYRYKPEDSHTVIELAKRHRQLKAEFDSIDKKIFNIGRDHYKQYVRTT